VNFNIADQLLIKYSTFIRHWRKKVGVQWHCVSVIYSVWEGLWLSQERSIIIQYSYPWHLQ